MFFETDAAEIIHNQRQLLDLFRGQQGSWQEQVNAATAAQVRDIYIDSLNGNDALVGTRAAPVKTIARAVALTPIGGAARWRLKGAEDRPAYEVTEVYPLEGVRVSITPWDTPPGGPAADRGLMPLLRFGVKDLGSHGISAQFQGGRILVLYCRIETAIPVGGQVNFSQTYYTFAGAFGGLPESGEATLEMVVCDINLRDLSLMHLANGGFGRLALWHCRMTESGVSTQGKLLRSTVSSPAIVAMNDCTLPAGRTAKQLLDFPGAAVDTAGKPTVLTTNVSYA